MHVALQCTSSSQIHRAKSWNNILANAQFSENSLQWQIYRVKWFWIQTVLMQWLFVLFLCVSVLILCVVPRSGWYICSWDTFRCTFSLINVVQRRDAAVISEKRSPTTSSILILWLFVLVCHSKTFCIPPILWYCLLYGMLGAATGQHPCRSMSSTRQRTCQRCETAWSHHMGTRWVLCTHLFEPLVPERGGVLCQDVFGWESLMLPEVSEFCSDFQRRTIIEERRSIVQYIVPSSHFHAEFHDYRYQLA